MTQNGSARQKVVIITGASSGFGRLTAQKLHDAGWRVFGTFLPDEAPPLGVPFTMLPLDVRDQRSVNDTVNTVLTRAGHIDALINNAGVELVGATEETTLAEGENLFHVNFFGAARMTQAVLPIMRAAGDGHIVYTSSIGGRVGLPYQSYYSASKHAIEGYVESLLYEVEPFGIDLTLIEPGAANTPLKDNKAETSMKLEAYNTPRKRVIQMWEKQLENGTDPEHIARAILNALNNPQPLQRRLVGTDARMMGAMKQYAPFGLLERMFRMQAGVEGPETAAVRASTSRGQRTQAIPINVTLMAVGVAAMAVAFTLSRQQAHRSHSRREGWAGEILDQLEARRDDLEAGIERGRRELERSDFGRDANKRRRQFERDADKTRKQFESEAERVMHDVERGAVKTGREVRLRLNDLREAVEHETNNLSATIENAREGVSREADRVSGELEKTGRNVGRDWRKTRRELEREADRVAHEARERLEHGRENVEEETERLGKEATRVRRELEREADRVAHEARERFEQGREVFGHEAERFGKEARRVRGEVEHEADRLAHEARERFEQGREALEHEADRVRHDVERGVKRAEWRYGSRGRTIRRAAPLVWWFIRKVIL